MKFRDQCFNIFVMKIELIIILTNLDLDSPARHMASRTRAKPLSTSVLSEIISGKFSKSSNLN